MFVSFKDIWMWSARVAKIVLYYQMLIGSIFV